MSAWTQHSCHRTQSSGHAICAVLARCRLTISATVFLLRPMALHLLQNCMVYVNTLMVQRVLGEPIWLKHMGVTEQRALTPLFWGHVNPYGTFRHVPARHDRPLAPRSAHPGRRSGSIPDPGRLMVRTNRYFAFGDTNVGSGPTYSCSYNGSFSKASRHPSGRVPNVSGARHGSIRPELTKRPPITHKRTK